MTSAFYSITLAFVPYLPLTALPQKQKSPHFKVRAFNFTWV